MSDVPGSIEIVMRDGVPTLVITLNIIIRSEKGQMTRTDVQSNDDGFETGCPLCQWRGWYANRSNAARAFNAHMRQMHPENRGTPLVIK